MSEVQTLKNIPEPKVIFATQSLAEQNLIQRYWYHQYPDIMLSILLISAGFFHFIFRKYVLISGKKIKDELDHQKALQQFYTSPYFGVVLIVVGFVLLFFSAVYYYLN